MATLIDAGCAATGNYPKKASKWVQLYMRHLLGGKYLVTCRCGGHGQLADTIEEARVVKSKADFWCADDRARDAYAE